MFSNENPFFKQAQEELAYLSGDPDFQYLVESRTWFLMDQNSYRVQARDEGLAEGLKKGKKEGLKESKLTIAKKLLKLKMPIEQIAEITELTKEEIEKLEN